LINLGENRLKGIGEILTEFNVLKVGKFNKKEAVKMNCNWCVFDLTRLIELVGLIAHQIDLVALGSWF